jgi:hypothetical protein
MDLKRGMDKAVKAVVENLKKQSENRRRLRKNQAGRRYLRQ